MSNAAEASSPKDAIRERALALGFDAIGFAPAVLGARARIGLTEFLANGYHGDMGWLADRASVRTSPDALWPEAQSVIVVGLNYGPERDPLDILGQKNRGAISVYAQGRDYHHVLKKKLRVLTRFVADSFQADVKLFVDTAPVMEKPLAQAAGLGWQGKHSNLVARDWGSWLFLGEIYTTLQLAPDDAERDHCGACSRCLSACPTDAFAAPYKLDARRCISYLTIEHKSHIAREFRVPMGNRIYGCDDCLAVCPWNKFAKQGQTADLSPRLELVAPGLADLAALDDKAFRSMFSGSPVKRLGRNRFIRNVLIAIGNSGDDALIQVARNLLEDESDLVRAMAIWALSRLLSSDEFVMLRNARIGLETDDAVREEWGAVPVSVSE